MSAILGHPVISSIAVPKTEADGKVSYDTPANNTKGQLVTFNRRGYVVGWRRRLKLETERIPATDQMRIVASLRMGFGRFTPTGAASGIESADVITTSASRRWEGTAMTEILHTGKGVSARPRQCNRMTAAGAVSVATYYDRQHHDRKRARVHLGAGSVKNQLKKIQLIVDGGDLVLTVAGMVGGNTITFADAGDTAVLQWNGKAWVPIELSNDADGVGPGAVHSLEGTAMQYRFTCDYTSGAGSWSEATWPSSTMPLPRGYCVTCRAALSWSPRRHRRRAIAR